MSKDKNFKSHEEKHYNWLMLADMYLATAVILSMRMLQTLSGPHEFRSNTQTIDKECGFTSRNEDYEAFVPAVFNLKHGTELYMKSLVMIIDSNQEYPATHDLLKLIDKLKASIKSGNVGSESLLSLIDLELHPLVKTYYYGTYAWCVDEKKPDVSNEAERYPESVYTNCYEIGDLHEAVTKAKLDKLISDARTLQRIFREEIYKSIPTSAEKWEMENEKGNQW